MDEKNQEIVIALEIYNKLLIMCNDYVRLIDFIKKNTKKNYLGVYVDGFPLSKYLELVSEEFAEFAKNLPEEEKKE